MVGLVRWLTLTLLLLASPAWAGPAEDAALRATDVRDEHCADMAQDRTSGMTAALLAVAPVLDEVSRVYDETAASFLLYWRGVLLECSNQEARAIVDLEAFADDADNLAALPQLVQDARRRLRRLGSSEAPGPPPITAPRLIIALGGNYDLVADVDAYHYGGVGLQGSIALAGPLRLLTFVNFSVGPPHVGAPEPERAALVPWGLGAELRVGDEVGFRAGGLFSLVVDGDDQSGFALLPGFSGLVGGAFKLGPAPLELRPELEVGVLLYFHLRVGVSLALRL